MPKPKNSGGVKYNWLSNDILFPRRKQAVRWFDVGDEAVDKWMNAGSGWSHVGIDASPARNPFRAPPIGPAIYEYSIIRQYDLSLGNVVSEE